MKRLAIVGSGDLGQLIAWHAATDGHYEVSGFFDDFKTKNEIIHNIPVLGGLADIQQNYKDKKFDELMIGIGYKHFAMRKKIFETYADQVAFGKLIHSSVFTDPSCSIGRGVFILPGCTLDMNVTIEDNVLMNTGCIIAHDSRIRAHSFISPGAVIAGFVNVGQCCNIGINTTIIDNVIIADEVQTGGGTVVIKNIDKAGLYVGNPARYIR